MGHTQSRERSKPSSRKRGYGGLLAPPTQQSGLPLHILPFNILALPSSVDLRKEGGGCYPYPLVDDQKELNNCSSVATASAIQCWQRKNNTNADLFIDPSAMFNYYYARQLIRSQRQFDAGTSAPESLNAFQYGVCDVKHWPYKSDLLNVTPSIEAQKNAQYASVTSWKQLEPSLDNVKRALVNNNAVIFSFVITKELDIWFNDRDMQLRTGFAIEIDEFSKSEIVASHTVLIVGYDDYFLGIGAFLCRNSWGSQFGTDGGHFWFPYPAATFPDLVNGFFIIDNMCINHPGTSTCVSSSQCKQLYDHTSCRI